MATIKEDYVSFQVARLLKDKGFDGECSRWYVANEPQEGIVERGFGENQFYINAPTLQMAMKWLREVHNKIIVPGIRVDDPSSGIINCYIVGIWYIPKNNGGAFCYTSPTPYNGYPSFEQACEVAIKYCLENLI